MSLGNEAKREPKGDLTVRTLCMPGDTNPAGDIFGGWIMSQMDVAGGLIGKKVSGGRVVTIAVDSMVFHNPVLVGDALCCYCDIVKIGNTSITIKVETWVIHEGDEDRELVTEGTFTYVAVTDKRVPRPIPQESKDRFCGEKRA